MSSTALARLDAPDLRDAPPRSVLIVRLSARGDVVFATPLVSALKRTFPDVRITWVVEPHTTDLIQHHPLLDEVMVWPRQELKRLLRTGRWLEAFKRLRAFRRELRARDFDLALDLQGLLKSASLAWLSGARVRVGVGSRELSHLLVHHRFSDPDLSRVSSQYRELAECMGLDTTRFQMEVGLSGTDRAFAHQWTAEQGLEDGYAVLVPFTTWPQKHWVEGRWAGVARGLRAELGLESILLGGPSDQPAAERIVRAEPAIHSLTGSTSLGQASALVERARLVVGVDTGLTHIALAYDRPTVCIHGPSIPYRTTPTARGTILREPLHCAPCWRNPTCGGRHTCMAMITVREVVQAAKQVLNDGH